MSANGVPERYLRVFRVGTSAIGHPHLAVSDALRICILSAQNGAEVNDATTRRGEMARRARDGFRESLAPFNAAQKNEVRENGETSGET